MEQRKIEINLRKHFLMVRSIGLWNKLPREGVETPSHGQNWTKNGGRDQREGLSPGREVVSMI